MDKNLLLVSLFSLRMTVWELEAAVLPVFLGHLVADFKHLILDVLSHHSLQAFGYSGPLEHPEGYPDQKFQVQPKRGDMYKKRVMGGRLPSVLMVCSKKKKITNIVVNSTPSQTYPSLIHVLSFPLSPKDYARHVCLSFQPCLPLLQIL